jgi:hypothetical protein
MFFHVGCWFGGKNEKTGVFIAEVVAYPSWQVLIAMMTLDALARS